MVRSVFYFLVGILPFSLVGFAAENPAAQKLVLYVGNSRGDDISIVDMESLNVIGDVKEGDRIHGVCVSPDATRLFVTVESDHSLRIVDTATRTTLGTVSLSGRPNQCAISGDGKYVAVPIRDKDNVEIIDIAQQKNVKSLPIKEPHNALNTGSSRYIFVSSMGSNEVDVIDLEKWKSPPTSPSKEDRDRMSFRRMEKQCSSLLLTYTVLMSLTCPHRNWSAE